MKIIAKKRAFKEKFIFETKADSAWYDYDGAESVEDGASLKINADREVYAIFTSKRGKKKYGTIGDKENETLADNYPVDEEVYYFYENPDTKDYYA